jgi:hypothetical protein
VDSQDGGTGFGRVAVAPLAAAGAPEPERYVTNLECARVYVAAQQGLCLTRSYAGGGAARPASVTLDGQLRPRSGSPFNGEPSRVRLAPDGRLGATTVFVTGDSYATAGFSTRTTIVDVAKNTPLADLEQFAAWRDNARIQAPDFNYWGVAFARDGNRFYATLATGGTTYLVGGDVAARRVDVLRENVECPSLSPDNTRLVFKKRVSAPGLAPRWQLHLLDIRTLAETPLPGETRSVDDQVEWLDDNHVLYALRDEGPPATIATNIWLATTDGSAPPRIFLRNALSPAVVRSPDGT